MCVYLQYFNEGFIKYSAHKSKLCALVFCDIFCLTLFLQELRTAKASLERQNAELKRLSLTMGDSVSISFCWNYWIIAGASHLPIFIYLRYSPICAYTLLTKKNN